MVKVSIDDQAAQITTQEEKTIFDLIEEFHRMWNRPIRWRGNMLAPSRILEQQAKSLAGAFLAEETYRAFHAAALYQAASSSNTSGQSSATVRSVCAAPEGAHEPHSTPARLSCVCRPPP